MCRNNYASFAEIKTKTITVQASNNRGDSKKAKLFITLKRSPDFFENMKKFNDIREENEKKASALTEEQKKTEWFDKAQNKDLSNWAESRMMTSNFLELYNLECHKEALLGQSLERPNNLDTREHQEVNIYPQLSKGSHAKFKNDNYTKRTPKWLTVSVVDREIRGPVRYHRSILIHRPSEQPNNRTTFEACLLVSL